MSNDDLLIVVDGFAAMYLLNTVGGIGVSVHVLKAGSGLVRFPAYVRKSDEIAAKGYEGFAFA